MGETTAFQPRIATATYRVKAWRAVSRIITAAKRDGSEPFQGHSQTSRERNGNEGKWKWERKGASEGAPRSRRHDTDASGTNRRNDAHLTPYPTAGRLHLRIRGVALMELLSKHDERMGGAHGVRAPVRAPVKANRHGNCRRRDRGEDSALDQRG
ncbi:hypothetical protein BGZ61DRAFT_228261 [Ilyonectria robusta]|uniref:uncharacterized protein n=1 Tax=Ilyonectria robusta TaxID=1079257 RepID=UPI001E8CE6CE|nr:uncharacterized protein BGZ61DRAFT_228261 [Ilyonectria robusta]KAH8706828.1 hypothetical protein BGZ61DRAFT_228261 [Ilyonectria robusta]